MITSRALAVFAALALAAGCSKLSRPGARPAPGAGAPSPSTPVAKVAGQVVTEGDLADAAKAQLARLASDHAEKLYEARKQALEGLIDKRLIDAKAKAEGLTPEKLVEREVTAKIQPAADSEIQMVYDRTKASGRQLPAFEQIKGEIANFLKDQKADQARRAFVDRLRAEAKVEILLKPPLPPKVEVAAGEGPTKGDPKAPVTIIEFSDFECGFCGRAEETVKRVLDEYKGKVRLVYRDYPLAFHAKAQKASEAALCAGDQGKYWEMHGKLFANQQALEVPQLKEHAKGLGLDAAKFDRCLDSGEKGKLVDASKKAGDAAGVSGTPAFFINGRHLSGAQPFDKFKEIIDHELSGGG